MNAKDYRRQVEAELGGAHPAEAALRAEHADDGEQPGWDELLAALKDQSSDAETRRAALRTLQASSFLGARFNPVRPAFVEALRDAATASDERLRRSALDILSNMKDPVARSRLIDGLTGKSEPLVPEAVALGMLSRDDHGSLGGIARQVLDSDAGAAAKAEAVNLLAGDPDASDLLGRLMQDKNGFREVRRASAAALHGLDQNAFIANGREILADKTDFSDIRKTVGAAFERAGLTVEPDAAQSQEADRGRTGFASRLANLLRRLLGRHEPG